MKVAVISIFLRPSKQQVNAKSLTVTFWSFIRDPLRRSFHRSISIAAFLPRAVDCQPVSDTCIRCAVVKLLFADAMLTLSFIGHSHMLLLVFLFLSGFLHTIRPATPGQLPTTDNIVPNLERKLRAKKVSLNFYCGIILTRAIAFVCGPSGTHTRNARDIKLYRYKRQIPRDLCFYSLSYYPNSVVSLCCCRKCNGRTMMEFCAA